MSRGASLSSRPEHTSLGWEPVGERLMQAGIKKIESLRVGALEARLAVSPTDVAAAQSLRYRVFYEEMGAHPSTEMVALRRDFDEFDDRCDHLLVVDHVSGSELVVGTYRLLRRSISEGRFYSANEYDIDKIIGVAGEIVELGRSCVDARYRTRATIQLLFRGIGAYVRAPGVALMFGCASFPGTDIEAVATQLAYLHHRFRGPVEIRPRALSAYYTEMNCITDANIDPRAAWAAMPPLIKGYLRAGGLIGDGAVIDRQFHTIDVCMVAKLDQVSKKFRHRYENGASEALRG